MEYLWHIVVDVGCMMMDNVERVKDERLSWQWGMQVEGMIEEWWKDETMTDQG